MNHRQVKKRRTQIDNCEFIPWKKQREFARQCRRDYWYERIHNTGGCRSETKKYSEFIYGSIKF